VNALADQAETGHSLHHEPKQSNQLPRAFGVKRVSVNAVKPKQQSCMAVTRGCLLRYVAIHSHRVRPDLTCWRAPAAATEEHRSARLPNLVVKRVRRSRQSAHIVFKDIHTALKIYTTHLYTSGVADDVLEFVSITS
jgi:hypothetical protein